MWPLPFSGMLNANIRCGAINEKSISVNDCNCVAKIKSAKNILSYKIVFRESSVLGVNVLSLQSRVNSWKLVCDPGIVVSVSFALDPDEFRMF